MEQVLSLSAEYTRYKQLLQEFLNSYNTDGQYSSLAFKRVVTAYLLDYKLQHNINYRELGDVMHTNSQAACRYFNMKSLLKSRHINRLLDSYNINIMDIIPEMSKNIDLLYFVCTELHRPPKELGLKGSVNKCKR